jgi:hypothetical protein
MKLLLKTIALFTIIAGFISCSPNPHADKVKTLDSIYIELSVAEEILSKQNHEVAKNISDEINAVSEIALLFLEDSVFRNNEAEKTINDYLGLKVPIYNFIENQPILLKEISTAQSQIKSLANDLKKGFVTENAADYFQTEVDLANSYLSDAKELSTEFEKTLLKFNTLQSKTTQLLDEFTVQKNLKSE